MKRLFLIPAFAITILLNPSCKKKDDTNSETKKDTTAPIVTLKGSGDLVLPFGIAFTDPGATAMDETDGDLTSSISSNWDSEVDVNNVAVKTVEYSVSDKSGNKGSTSRKVTVKYLATNVTGEYNAIYTFTAGNGSPFTATVSVGDSENQIKISPFYGGNAILVSELSGETGDSFPINQNANQIQVNGSGKIENKGQKITLTYTLTYSNSSQPVVAVLIRK